MIHHVSLGTNDVERSRRFYDPVMQLLGLRLLRGTERALDYGVGDVLLSLEAPLDGRPATAGNGAHIAFQARDRGMVKDFYETALANGGTSDGPPGVREVYDAHYYGAFVRDPDGNKIEAVTYSAD